MIYFSLVFIILASICNAVMDKSTHHYHTSIFKKFNNEMWWNGEISWKNKYVDGDYSKGRVKWFFGLNKPVQLTDAFHFFKMWMVIFICLSIITFDKCLVFVDCSYRWYSFLIVLGVYGTLWNTTFSLFYNKILDQSK
ncbi:MAG: hypothetical protein ACK5OW_01830 [bacterium]|jgi:hypothetical protein